jgi:hypothetical protein
MIPNALIQRGSKATAIVAEANSRSAIVGLAGAYQFSVNTVRQITPSDAKPAPEASLDREGACQSLLPETNNLFAPSGKRKELDESASVSMTL